jgi:ribosome biogenesis protein UTP30
MSEEECSANVIAAVQGALRHIPRKWANVRALHLKTADSAALPLYQAIPDAPVRIEGAKTAGGKGSAVAAVQEA